jgi:large subunit ribosomal protein L4
LKPGGGITFGPKPKDWSIDMNKKEKKLAMATALQSAASDMTVLDAIPSIEGRKTKSLVSLLKNVGVDVMETKTLLVTKEANTDVRVSGKNIAKLAINEADCLRLTDVLNADRIIVEKDALQYLNEKFQ